MKRCPACGEDKPLTEFYWQRPRPSRGQKGRYGTECKTCAYRKVREYRAANRELIAEQRRRRRLLKKYGLTPEAYDALLAAQGGKCPICGSPGPRSWSAAWHVDHDHETGEVRGLLCLPCNARLGILEDREWMDAALRYLESPPALVFKRGW